MFQPSTTSSVIRSTHFAPAASIRGARFYSAPAGLSKNEVEGRIVDLLKNFDKVIVDPFHNGTGGLLILLIAL